MVVTSYGRNKNRDDEIKKTKRRPIIAPAIAVRLLIRNNNIAKKQQEKLTKKDKTNLASIMTNDKSQKQNDKTSKATTNTSKKSNNLRKTGSKP